ncbi:TRI15 protein [Coniella lustricola]|uniref:TRI15 protein n=1 Tax=Coniella lustricola TaxID=2025994 RepID=A0A2T3A0D5_9PEZI|nr:TRI15 protein [Coniella lustricola]
MAGNSTAGCVSDHSTRCLDTEHLASAFVHGKCLFCNKLSDSLHFNTTHMQKSHSFLIPDKNYLVVDVETLLSYLHLIISKYRECICCGTQRATKRAAQQHMLDKGHCRFDHKSYNSEFADFYDYSIAEDDAQTKADDTSVCEDRHGSISALSMQVDETTLRLPSGKVVSNRSRAHAAPCLAQRHTIEHSSNTHHAEEATSTTKSSQSPIMRRSDLKTSKRRNKASKQLAALSTTTERSLAHLSLPEQRAVLAVQQKQVEAFQRAKDRYRSRLETLGNKSLMTHFVRDAADKRTMWK